MTRAGRNHRHCDNRRRAPYDGRRDAAQAR